ncbi:MAG: zf-HC2 domain-containing protein [Clostridia bacterium]|nr:zf-HC2 domain-containing protein [Clostridia bacterium]
MKNDLPCEVVRDLLPSYIDGLTSPETAELIEAHLSTCETCRAIHREMTGQEPPKAEQPEVDYLKKVRASGRRLRRIAIAAGCAVIVLGVTAFWISRAYKQQAASDAETITALQASEEDLQKQAAADAETITILKESEEELKRQMELPTVLYNAETGVLVVTGTGDYDQIVIPDEAENAKTLDVQDDEFHLSADMAILKGDIELFGGKESLQSFLPGFIDRTDRSLSAIRTYIREHAPSVYPVEDGDKMVEISIHEYNNSQFRNERDRILLSFWGDLWTSKEEQYLLALLNTKTVGWGQVGYAWYVGFCLNPYSEYLGCFNLLPYATEEYYKKGLGEFYDVLVQRSIHFPPNMTASDWRIWFDGSVSRAGVRVEADAENDDIILAPLSRYRYTTLTGKTNHEDASMSVWMAASFVAWLDDMYGFEAVSAYCFGQKTFDETFGTDFTTAFEAWKAWIVETYPVA